MYLVYQKSQKRFPHFSKLFFSDFRIVYLIFCSFKFDITSLIQCATEGGSESFHFNRIRRHASSVRKATTLRPPEGSCTFPGTRPNKAVMGFRGTGTTRTVDKASKMPLHYLSRCIQDQNMCSSVVPQFCTCQSGA